jgi:hypothetical protein
MPPPLALALGGGGAVGAGIKEAVEGRRAPFGGAFGSARLSRVGRHRGLALRPLEVLGKHIKLWYSVDTQMG